MGKADYDAVDEEAAGSVCIERDIIRLSRSYLHAAVKVVRDSKPMWLSRILVHKVHGDPSTSPDIQDRPWISVSSTSIETLICHDYRE